MIGLNLDMNLSGSGVAGKVLPSINITAIPTLSGSTAATGNVTRTAQSISDTPGASILSSDWYIDGIGSSGSAASAYDKSSIDTAFVIRVRETWTAPGYTITTTDSATLFVDALTVVAPIIYAPTVDMTTALPDEVINVTAGAVMNTPFPDVGDTTLTALIDDVENDSSTSSPWAYTVPAGTPSDAVIVFRQDTDHAVTPAIAVSESVTVTTHAPLAFSGDPIPDILSYDASFSIDVESFVTGGSGSYIITEIHPAPAWSDFTDGVWRGTPVADKNAPEITDFDLYEESTVTAGKVGIQLKSSYAIPSGSEVAIAFGDFDLTTLDYEGSASILPVLDSGPGGVRQGGIGTEWLSNGDFAGVTINRAAILRNATTKVVEDIVYFPAISIADVTDTTAPILSAASVVSFDATSLLGTITTDEGGSAWWVATQSSTTPSAAQIKAGQDHTGSSADADDDTVFSGPGTYEITATGLTTGTVYWLHFVQDDRSGNISTPITTSGSASPTSTSANFTVASIEADQTFDGGAHIAGRELHKVWDLKEDGSGSQWTENYKDITTIESNAGISRSGTSITVTSAFDGTLEGWDFTGYMLKWSSGKVRVRNCKFGEENGTSGVLSYLFIEAGAAVYEIAYNSFVGPNMYGGASPAVAYRSSNSSYPDVGADGDNPDGWVHHNKFTQLTEDAIKPTGGLIEYNAIIYDKNLNSVGQNVDPHTDAINPFAIQDPLTIRRNYIEMSQRTDGLSKGSNNAFRMAPNGSPSDAPYLQSFVYENVVVGAKDASSFLFAAEQNGLAGYNGPAFVNNFVRANDQSVLYPTIGPGTIWEGNRDLNDNSLITTSADGTRLTIAPSNTVRIPSSGTATTGKVIEGRAVGVDDSSQTTPWLEVATADGSGDWSGDVLTPRAVGRLRPEWRQQDEPGSVVQSAQYCFAGRRWDVVGQSDINYPFALNSQHKTAREAVTEESVPANYLAQVASMTRVYANPASPGDAQNRKPTTSDGLDPVLARIARMASFNCGGEPIALRTHTVSGVGLDAQVKLNQWHKEDDLQLYDVMPTNPGVVFHLASSGTNQHNAQKDFLGPFIIGLNPDGSAFNPPDDLHSAFGTAIEAEWSWPDEGIIDWDASNDPMFIFDRMWNPTTYASMKANYFEMADDPVYAQYMGPKIYSRGQINGAMKGADGGHPYHDSLGGDAMAAELWLGHMVLRTGQTGNLTMPIINTIEVDGNNLKLGWTDGLITTPHRHSGQARLDQDPKYVPFDTRRFDESIVSESRIRDDDGNLADHGRLWLKKSGGGNWSTSDIQSLTVDGLRSSDGYGTDDFHRGWTHGHYLAGWRDGWIAEIQKDDDNTDMFANHQNYAPGWDR